MLLMFMFGSVLAGFGLAALYTRLLHSADEQRRRNQLLPVPEANEPSDLTD